eukprot:1394543-Amphidinium_carterae.2
MDDQESLADERKQMLVAVEKGSLRYESSIEKKDRCCGALILLASEASLLLDTHQLAKEKEEEMQKIEKVTQLSRRRGLQDAPRFVTHPPPPFVQLSSSAKGSSAVGAYLEALGISRNAVSNGQCFDQLQFEIEVAEPDCVLSTSKQSHMGPWACASSLKHGCRKVVAKTEKEDCLFWSGDQPALRCPDGDGPCTILVSALT